VYHYLVNIILGINWEQNSTAALMIDGKVVGCSSEERFSGVKNDERYPINAINWLLNEFKVSPNDITCVAFISKQWSPTYSLIRHYSGFDITDHIKEQDLVWKPRLIEGKIVNTMKVFHDKLDLDQYPGRDFWQSVLEEMNIANDHTSNSELEKIGKQIRSNVVKEHLEIESDKIKFIDHHLGHAAYAFFGQELSAERTLVLTIDAFGDNSNYSAWLVTNSEGKYQFEKIVKGSNFIIAHLYRYTTLILNMKPNEHEYKVMGLAPYCKSKYAEEVYKVLADFQYVEGREFKDGSRPKDLYFSVLEKLKGFRFDSIAGGLQLYTERLVTKWVSNLVEEFKPQAIALGGGVAMNVKMNSVISGILQGKAVNVPPSPDDSSQAMGVLYAASAMQTSEPLEIYTFDDKLQHVSSPYLGPKYNIDKQEIIDFLNNQNLCNIEVLELDYEKVVGMLLKGSIVGRFSGNAEFGARALGNRSILADPRHPKIKIKINEAIKSRDFWMPFAASVILEHATEYLILQSPPECYAYMTNACETTILGREVLAAAIHPYDNTCRPQIVNQRANSEYHKLIKTFGDKSGVFGLLNTSFNVHGKPIVGSPTEALQVFTSTDLDCLILGDFFLIKNL